MSLLKRLKGSRFVTIVLNLKNIGKLKSNSPLYKKYGINKKLWQPISYQSIKKHDNQLPWLDQPLTPEFINKTSTLNNDQVLTESQILQWREKGCISIPGFFSKEEIDEVEASILEDLSENEKQKYFSNRLINLFHKNKQINKMFRSQRLLKIVSFIFGKEVAPFQTINFYKSSSQLAHSDSIHLTTEPLGYLVGVWVALEDVVEGSGEFFYYPGSHKLEYVLNNGFEHKNKFLLADKDLHTKYDNRIAEIIKEKDLKQETFLPKKGDILIWHANLLHGSCIKKDPSATRKSLIMHYFAQGVLCYHEFDQKPVVFTQ